MYSENSDIDDFVSICSSDNSLDSFYSIPSLENSIHSFLSDVPKNFNVLHINAQSIPAHFTDMMASFEHRNIHAILVSESWLKPCLKSNLYRLPGFHLIRNDRIGCGGGGVAIYLRSNIPFTVVNMSTQPPPPNAGEHLFIEVTLSHTKLLLGVYYCPSLRVNFFASFEKLLEDLCPLYKHTIIMGDFNTCLLKQDSRACTFKSMIESNNLTILPLNATHNFPNSIPSLLDLILVSSVSNVAKHGQCAADAFSCHDLIYLSYKTRPPKCKAKILLQRNFGAINMENLRREARDLDWSDVINAQYIDDKVNVFNRKITKLYDTHAPIRPVKMKHLPAPWLTTEIKAMRTKKLTAKARYKCKPSEHNKRTYIQLRNECNKVCRNAQRRHIHNSLENEDPSKVWKFLRSLGIGKSRQDNLPNAINIDNLNQHFSSSNNFDGPAKAATLRFLSSIPKPDHPSFIFDQFTDRDVKRNIEAISSNAVGSDCISRKMIILITDEIMPILQHILNSSISCSVFPSMWKEAQVIPLPKKTNPSVVADFRPISILPFLSKLLERLVHQQLTTFLISNNLFNNFQSGFRPGHSTVTALVNITDDIRLGMEHGKVTVLSLLDQ